MTLLIFLLSICIYLAVINRRAYNAFADDKRRAIRKDQRTPEVHLLYLAKIGGWLGAKIAQKKLRHKSSKQPFGQQLNTIGAVQAACITTFLVIIGFLALSPLAEPFIAPNAATVTAHAAVQAGPPADGQLAISLRPPEGRRAGL